MLVSNTYTTWMCVCVLLLGCVNIFEIDWRVSCRTFTSFLHENVYAFFRVAVGGPWINKLYLAIFAHTHKDYTHILPLAPTHHPEISALSSRYGFFFGVQIDESVRSFFCVMLYRRNRSMAFIYRVLGRASWCQDEDTHQLRSSSGCHHMDVFQRERMQQRVIPVLKARSADKRRVIWALQNQCTKSRIDVCVIK